MEGRRQTSGRRRWEFLAGGLFCLFLLADCSTLAAQQEEPEPWLAYLRAFRRQLDLVEQDVPHIAALAEGVADQYVEEERLWGLETLRSFHYELIGRAGGLTGYAPPSRKERHGPETDILLVPLAPDGPSSAEKAELVATALGVPGCRAIAFANERDLTAVSNKPEARPLEPSDFYGVIDNHAPEGEFTFAIPGAEEPGRAHLSSVVNQLNGWLFVGELTAAATRRGRMPNFWLSFAIDHPRGYPRAHRYRRPDKHYYLPQRRFHEDWPVKPIPAERVGRRYLDHFRFYLDRFEKWPDLKEAAEKMAATVRGGKKVYVYSVGHNFSHEVPEPERDYPLTVMETKYTEIEEDLAATERPGDLLFLLCMPVFEEGLVRAALGSGMEVIAVSAFPHPEDLWEEDRFTWIAAPWPTGDGSVELPGYDIRILPVTGVMNAVIYYAVRSQVTYELARPAQPDAPPGE